MSRLRSVVLIAASLPVTAAAQVDSGVLAIVPELASQLQLDGGASKYVIVRAARPGHDGMSPAVLDSLGSLLDATVLDTVRVLPPCPWRRPPETPGPSAYALYVDTPSLRGATAIVSIGFRCQQFQLGWSVGFAKDIDYVFEKTPAGWRFVRSHLRRIT